MILSTTLTVPERKLNKVYFFYLLRSRFLVYGELEVLTTQKDNSAAELSLFTWEDVKVIASEADNHIIFLGVGDIEKGKLLRETHGAVDDDDIPYFAINFLTVSYFPTI